MKKLLNLTEADRCNVFVTFNVNCFEATCGQDGFLIGKYSTKDRMMEDFKMNRITNAKLDSSARSMYFGK